MKELDCVQYNGYNYVTALVFSIFLGLFAVDRFYLGYVLYGIFKLLTLSGLGVWWLVDIVLMANGNIQPNDGYNWEPYY